jgi:hypothetical protein
VEVAEKHVFFWQKWLKDVHFSGGSGLKKERFLGRSG